MYIQLFVKLTVETSQVYIRFKIEFLIVCFLLRIDQAYFLSFTAAILVVVVVIVDVAKVILEFMWRQIKAIA